MTKRLLSIALVVAAIVVVHVAMVRPWFMRWGATDREIAAQWPGDDLAAHPDTVTLRAVTVDAAPDAIWPWILQLGQERAGWYSYRLLENLVGCRMPRIHHVVAEFQHREVGDNVWMYPADRLNGAGHVVVARVEPRRALILATMPMGESAVSNDSTIAFILDPIDAARTRLIMRSRGPNPSSLRWRLFDRALFQPAHFVMERRMMLTIKALAEGGDPDETADILQALFWIAIGLSSVLALTQAWLSIRWRRALFAMAAGAAALGVATLIQPPVPITALLAAAVAASLGPFPSIGLRHAA